ncbi:hypothetical protein Avbf_09584 [Armadillidium vulgare]|nr:hypothetical protein Avbf_09584 [Armadillidium vulgare]
MPSTYKKKEGCSKFKYYEDDMVQAAMNVEDGMYIYSQTGRRMGLLPFEEGMIAEHLANKEHSTTLILRIDLSNFEKPLYQND